MQMRPFLAASFVALLVPACAAEPVLPDDLEAVDHGDQESAATGLTITDDWDTESTEGWVLSPILDAPAGATRVSAMITLTTAGALPVVEARVMIGGEPASDWVPLVSTFSEVDMHVAVADFAVVADAAQVRTRDEDVATIGELRWSAVAPRAPGDGAAPEIAGRAEGLRSELSGLGIVPREDWGARRTSCSPTDGPRTRFSIHHTEGPATDPARQLRGIQSYHISKGWCDVGYHFLIGTDGRIYEGRPVQIRGVHVRSNNTGNLGISFIGCFDSRECSSPQTLTDQMVDRAGRLIGTLGNLYRLTPSASNIIPHGDQVSTTCPGNIVRGRLSEIVSIARTRTLGPDPAPEPEPEPTPEPDPTPEPTPTGRTCTHSFGGIYSHLGCSASYQCCDGTWRTRTSGCGSCACTETTGETGCTVTSPTPDPTPDPDPGPAPTGLPHAGLTLSMMEIPRAGLSNPTLRSALGVSTEPYGTVVTVEGRQWVRGKVSWFGGPRDTGVTSTETGAITGERLRSLNDPVDPSAATLASRPEDYYFVAMRWNYNPNGRTWWRDARILVRNPTTGATIVVRPVDWGPNTRTRRIIDLSPQAVSDLGLTTDQEALVAFAPPGTPLGVVR